MKKLFRIIGNTMSAGVVDVIMNMVCILRAIGQMINRSASGSLMKVIRPGLPDI